MLGRLRIGAIYHPKQEPFRVHTTIERHLLEDSPSRSTRAKGISDIPRLHRHSIMTLSKRSLRFFAFLASASIVLAGHGLASASTERHFKVVNESGETLTVEWVNPKSGQRIPLGAPTSGEVMEVNSFVNHTFVIRSKPGNANSTEEYYRVTEDIIQALVIKDGLVVEEQKSMEELTPTSPRVVHVDISTDCRQEADQAMKEERIPKSDIFERFFECLLDNAAELIVVKADELVLEAELRKRMSRLAEDYTCADMQRETSPPVEVRQWTHGGMEREVYVLHNRPSSQIHMLKNFISEEECLAVQAAAKPLLHNGTVADGKGGSMLSENRKALQAGLKVNWSAEADGDPIAAVSRRLFDYTNHAVGYNLTAEGQEDLMAIQYFGRGKYDPTPDRYTPHCDGQCDGQLFKRGGRVATMVMYCDVPTVGGFTNFQNANVIVRPVVRSLGSDKSSCAIYI